MKTLTFALLLCMAAVATGQQAYDLPPPPVSPPTPAGRCDRYEERVAPPHAYRPAPGKRPYNVDDRYAAVDSAPIGAIACSPVCAECLYPDSNSKVEHLLQAAKHLEAAGYKDRAAEARHEAHKQKQAQLRHRIDQKLAEIEALKAEIARLESHGHAQRQVQIDVKLLEMAKETAQAGLDLECLDGTAVLTSDNLKVVAGMEESSKVNGAVEKLRRYGSVKVLAEPSLITVSGRPAFFRTGGEVPQLGGGPDGSPVVVEHSGIQVDMLPKIVGDGKVRLEFKIRLSQLDQSKTFVVDGQTYPRLRVRDIDTGAEVESGKTLVISSLLPSVEKETAGQKARFLLLLTPKILEHGTAPRTARADGHPDHTPPPQAPPPETPR